MSIEFLAAVVSFLLTLMVFSYLVGDNPAFKIAVYIFVGVTAGYVAAVAWWQVLLPDLIRPLMTGTPATRAMLAVPLALKPAATEVISSLEVAAIAISFSTVAVTPESI